ncbi:MFS transporter [Clostridium fallax]|uniref:Predicted arabinose efflux permease, MFS family n=1 Tax=Clostridium fallax TaxID=1533 RepID=A0A1M4TMY6_9CLOT|nr:MFS transporter [Clostridium fallax]SHE45755.1 Predicted arabinose efflux permease, MFS family [Clostridium fallax]SQB22488.1 major facilitator family transporter [Clostridium fallax]
MLYRLKRGLKVLLKRGKSVEKEYSKNARMYLYGIVFFYICSGAFSMIQGLYIKELGIEESFLGFILSTKTAAIALSSIPCALIVTNIGKKKGIILAMLFTPIFIIFQGISSNRWNILLFSILQGAVNGFIVVSEGPFFMENSNEKTRLKLFSYAFAVNVFSTMFGYFVFGNASRKIEMIFGSIIALRYTIILCGIVGLIGCLFVYNIKENDDINIIKDYHQFFSELIKVSTKKYPSKFLIYNAIIGFGAGLVVPYFNVYLKYKANATTDQIGLIMAFSQLSMGIGGLITPIMARKLGRVKTINICQIISIPFLMLIALPPNIYIVAIALFIRNGLMNMTGPVVGAMTMELINKDERSIFASINNISNNLFRALSTALGGFIMANLPYGYEVPYFITALMYLIATILFYKYFHKFDKKTIKIKVKNT